MLEYELATKRRRGAEWSKARLPGARSLMRQKTIFSLPLGLLHWPVLAMFNTLMIDLPPGGKTTAPSSHALPRLLTGGPHSSTQKRTSETRPSKPSGISSTWLIAKRLGICMPLQKEHHRPQGCPLSLLNTNEAMCEGEEPGVKHF
jgi:hypothetical protein